jgi:uncharacterized protein (UPF0333 family)
MKAQVSVEFLVLVSFLLLAVIVIFYYGTRFQSEATLERVYNDAKTLVEEIAFEINLASKAGNGYIRKFYVPKDVLGRNFTIVVSEYHVTLSYEEGAVSTTIVIDDIVGNVTSGWNLITNVNGVIHVQSTSS